MPFRYLLLIAIILSASSCISHKFAERKFQETKAKIPFDVVIVPGITVMEGEQSEVMQGRMHWAKYLMDSGYTKNVIFSGAAVESPYIEGLSMKLFADAMGIDPSHTFAETKAEHSTENVFFGIKMAKSMGFKKIALASDPFQTKLLRAFIKKRGENIDIVPIVFKRIDPTMERKISLPEVKLDSAFVKDFIPLSHRQTFFERLRGTNGKHIDYKQP